MNQSIHYVALWGPKLLSLCIDPVKICSCYKGEGSDECDDGRQHQTVDGEAEDSAGGRDHSGQDECGGGSRAYDLSPSKIEGWVEDAKRGMENALRANPLEIREQYEKQLKDLQEAYGEAMLELRARKKLAALMERGEPLSATGPRAMASGQ